MIEKSYSFCYTNHVYSHIILNAGKQRIYACTAGTDKSRGDVCKRKKQF